ncbi:MAG: nucleoside deaminase [Hyphomicrobiales bacterium]|nr:nucleoside deaminase [Hyphomicrobiales bacterium]
MKRALILAQEALEADEVPVGAVIVDSQTGTIIAEARNSMQQAGDATAHAELTALKAAMVAKGDARLAECDLYVTLEPCPMCAAAIALVRIRRVYYGAEDPKSGGVDHGPRIFQSSSCHHQPEVVSGIMEKESAKLLRIFFQSKR